MTRDRLPELLQHSISSTSSNGSMFADVINQNPSSTTNSGPNNNSMTENLNINAILSPYSEIRLHISQITRNLDAMSRMAQSINIRNFNENEMDDLRNQNLKLGNQLMNKFREFKSNLPAKDDYCLEARMKRSLFYGLYQNFINNWQRNEDFLKTYESKLKKNLQIHSHIINCNSTEEEIEELIANKTTNLFVGNILEETEKERKTLRDLMDRFNELKKLEKSIEDVHALFLRIQTLVMEQSEIIQRVEFHAQQATLYVDKGQDELSRAEHYQRKARKKKIIIIAILVALLIVLVFVGIYL